MCPQIHRLSGTPPTIVLSLSVGWLSQLVSRRMTDISLCMDDGWWRAPFHHPSSDSVPSMGINGFTLRENNRLLWIPCEIFTVFSCRVTLGDAKSDKMSLIYILNEMENGAFYCGVKITPFLLPIECDRWSSSSTLLRYCPPSTSVIYEVEKLCYHFMEICKLLCQRRENFLHVQWFSISGNIMVIVVVLWRSLLSTIIMCCWLCKSSRNWQYKSVSTR